ncbi:GNAT family N-acetyltransferase [Phormidium sp. FACHB-1136]|uniref:GNAT family N-acetyltransferase n=1 Tax=Phormidium sp. FACHB-1136 TaxID=2692848 RepID=UPI0016874451|nr:GNAT family N-acetyltransferase [Phormidium sp. FACHB-1136]MBD2428744.1 N-acetyltransferase [Phormidium sp. FACHB-1136]
MSYPPTPQITATWVRQIEEVPQAAWDALALPLATPFLEWDWLHNMERSGSAVANAGWQPCHLTLWRGKTLVGAAPMYLKGHSYGEFVFDHQWADLADRLGVNYYPKLLGMSPFTPAEGYRFLIAPDEDEAVITRAMVEAIDGFCVRNDISGCHFLYVDPAWRERMTALGFSQWLHHSYIWQNQGFQDFGDYLNIFNANQRRNIKRERKSVTTAGLRMEAIAGEAITHALCDRMYDYYADTCDKFGWWGSKYLTRKFFNLIHHNYRHRMVLFAAFGEDDHDPVGMSFCLTKGDRLYGRYWGSKADLNHLHFNACYYAPIEWGIANGIQIFDPGAGGRHKKRRGFPATPNHSLHRFYEPRLQTLLVRYIQEVNGLEQREMDAINADLPLKGR